MKSIEKYNYKGTFVSFDYDDNYHMINATQMAKPFGKLIGGFLRTQATKDYIELLESRYEDLHIGQKTPKREVLRVVKGGEPELQGTWMDEKLALKFAAWLSPEFELWVYDVIEELAKKGSVTLAKSLSPAEQLLANAQLLVDHERRMVAIEQRQDKLALQIDHNVSYMTTKAYARENGYKMPIRTAQNTGRTASKICRDRGIEVGSIPTEAYGSINSYPLQILAAVFKNNYK